MQIVFIFCLNRTGATFQASLPPPYEDFPTSVFRRPMGSFDNGMVIGKNICRLCFLKLFTHEQSWTATSFVSVQHVWFISLGPMRLPLSCPKRWIIVLPSMSLITRGVHWHNLVKEIVPISTGFQSSNKLSQKDACLVSIGCLHHVPTHDHYLFRLHASLPIPLSSSTKSYLDHSTD